MKTLYVSDLDGTLLRRDQTLSPGTVKALNELMDEGLLFSYATARSQITASKVTAGLSVSFPVIVYNGAFILEYGTGRILKENFLKPEETERIFALLEAGGIAPLVYAYLDGVEKFSYDPSRVNNGMRTFLLSRQGDIRERKVQRQEDLRNGNIFYFTCIDRPEKLLPVYRLLKEDFYCVYQKDIYSGEPWLEIMPRQATKANAVPELKAIASGVIGSNEEDGVVHWLRNFAIAETYSE